MNPLKPLRSFRNACKTGSYVWAVNHKAIREQTVLLESKNGMDLAGNIFRLLQVLTGEQYKSLHVYLSVHPDCKKQIRELTKRYNIQNYTMVSYNSRKYYQLLATAKYLVEDTSFPAKFIKREGQIYLNTWHGTPWKMMGRDEEAGAYAIGNVQKNFLCADYLLYPNQYMKDIMFSAYMLEGLYQGRVLYNGYPRNAVFFQKERAKELRRELGLEGKQVIVYMPTWRGSAGNKNTSEVEEACACYFDKLEELLGDNQLLLVKFHLFAAKLFPFEDYKHIKPFPKEYEPYDVLNAADILVTDYSSVLYDFANTGKKIILLHYDFESYLGARGLYTQPEEFPFPIAHNAEELAAEINLPKNYSDEQFLKKYCSYDGPEAITQLAERVFGEESGKESRREAVSEKQPKRVLVFSSGLDQNGLTTSLLNVMKLCDRINTKYYFTFFQSSMKATPERIRLVPENVSFLPINGTVTDHTPMELLAFKLYYRFQLDVPFVYHYIRRLYAREYRKHFGFADFDGVLHFTGYSQEVTAMLSTAPCKRVIFVHSDMKREVETRANHHIPTLRHAYHEYDTVAAVSESVKKSLAGLCEPEKVVVIQNAHDVEGVTAKAEQELVIDRTTLMNVSEQRLREVLADDSLVRFISVGRFSPEKGHKKLITAFDRYYGEHPETVLIIIGGNGGLYEETRRYAASLPCAQAVILIRALSNPFPVVKRCQLFLLSSDYEALGLVLFEAETLGVPAISTDIPGPADFLKKYGGMTVENSVDGVYSGMQAYRGGRVHTLGISFTEYNRKVAEQFNHLF